MRSGAQLMDVLDEILGSLRLTGGVIVDGEFTGDYCVQAEFTPEKCAPFFPMPERLIGYHYVRSGTTIAEIPGLPAVPLKAGEIVILPRNDPHRLSSQPGLPPANIEDIRVITAEGVHQVGLGTDGPKTKVWCGFLGTARDSVHPLLDALPPLMVLDVNSSKEAWLDASMRFLATGQPGPETVAKLAELFLAQAIREYVEQLPRGSTGWLKGLSDPAVSKALSVIHARYAEDLDIETLAREVGAVANGARRALRRADRRAADALLRAVADADCREHAARGQVEHREHRLFGRLQQRSGVQPRVQAGIWRTASDLAAPNRGGGSGAGAGCGAARAAAADGQHVRCEGRNQPGLVGGRRGAGAGEDRQLAQPPRVRLRKPDLARMDRGDFGRPAADPL